MGRSSKSPSLLSSIGLASGLVGAPGLDPEYVMQLVNDVRGFADVLLHLKEAFQYKGETMKNRNAEVFVEGLCEVRKVEHHKMTYYRKEIHHWRLLLDTFLL